MDIKKLRKQDLVEAILDIANHANEMTTSDLQAVVDAFVERLLANEEE